MQRTSFEPRTSQHLQGTKRTWFASTFRALQHRNFRLFFYGQLVSLIGTWMQSVAQQWLVYQLTNSASKLGMVAAAGTLPVLFLSLGAGVLVDRLPKHKLIFATQTVAMVLAFVLAALVAFDVVQFWHVLVLATLLGTVNAIDMPARQAFTPEMVAKEDVPNAIALNSSIFNAARAIGPAVAGLLVAAVGEAVAFGINGLSYLAVLASLAMMRVAPFERNTTKRAPFMELMDGLRYVARDRLKRVLLSVLVVHSIFGTLHVTLMPVFAQDVFVVQGWRLLEDGEARLGILMASFGLGALLGAILIAAFADRVPVGLRITVGLLVFPVSFILFSFASSFWVALLLLAVGGWSMITLLATSNTLLQTTTPDELRGRVMSLYTMTLVGLMPFGHLLAGFLADRFDSAPMAVRLAQCIVLLTGITVTLLAPQVRRAT